MHLAQALPDTANGAAVADRHDNPIRKVARGERLELLDHLERHCLLALNQVWIDCAVAVVPTKLLTRRHAEFPGLVVGPLD